MALSRALRSVHELSWALLLLRVLGISVLTGVLAIGLPHAGVFAKVFAEHLDEADQRPARIPSPGLDALSRFLCARAPPALGAMRICTLCRLECGLRSSACIPGRSSGIFWGGRPRCLARTCAPMRRAG